MISLGVTLPLKGVTVSLNFTLPKKERSGFLKKETRRALQNNLKLHCHRSGKKHALLS